MALPISIEALMGRCRRDLSPSSALIKATVLVDPKASTLFALLAAMAGPSALSPPPSLAPCFPSSVTMSSISARKARAVLDA